MKETKNCYATIPGVASYEVWVCRLLATRGTGDKGTLFVQVLPGVMGVKLIGGIELSA